VTGNHFVDMVSNLWKRAKPNNIDECAAVPQPQLPSDRDSNASIWISSTTASSSAAPATGVGATTGANQK